MFFFIHLKTYSCKCVSVCVSGNSWPFNVSFVFYILVCFIYLKTCFWTNSRLHGTINNASWQPYSQSAGPAPERWTFWTAIKTLSWKSNIANTVKYDVRLDILLMVFIWPCPFWLGHPRRSHLGPFGSIWAFCGPIGPIGRILICWRVLSVCGSPLRGNPCSES